MHGYSDLPSENDDSASGQQLRNRQTRILWDPNYQDPERYGDIGINGRAINWIPSLKAMVNQYYPGHQIGFTEYNWGDEANLNGATTQADVLGIYGREGIDLATRWTVAKNTATLPATIYVTYLASQIYRNYDGMNSTFGDVSVSASVANPDNLLAFAATRSSDGALTVLVINKQSGSTPVALSIANFSAGGTAQIWQISSASQTSIARLGDLPLSAGTVSLTAPSQSITLLVIPRCPAWPEQPSAEHLDAVPRWDGHGRRNRRVRGCRHPGQEGGGGGGALVSRKGGAQRGGVLPQTSPTYRAQRLAGAFPWPIGSKDSQSY